MREAVSIFWRKAWDNLGHLVAFNMIWLTATLPLMLALAAVVSVFTVRVPGPQHPPAASAAAEPAADAAPASETAEPPGMREPAPAPDADAAPAPGVDAGAPADMPSMTSEFRWSLAGIPALTFLAIAWVLVCIATGFVFYGMADIVTEYDFSGYRYVLKRFLRRGPVLRSVVIPTLFLTTFAVSVANILFYLHLSRSYGVLLFVLAGIMLWFTLFITMIFALALPICAQRSLTTWQSLRVAASFVLSSPGRSLGVLATGVSVFFLGLMSIAGAGFFAVAAPAVLFNADAMLHLREVEAPPSGTPPAQE